MQPLLAVALLATACALQPRTVIVTGATGKTGQAVVQALLRDEATTIRCFVRNKTKAELVLPQDPRVRLCSVDLEDQAALAARVQRFGRRVGVLVFWQQRRLQGVILRLRIILVIYAIAALVPREHCLNFRRPQPS